MTAEAFTSLNITKLNFPCRLLWAPSRTRSSTDSLRWHLWQWAFYDGHNGKEAERHTAGHLRRSTTDPSSQVVLSVRVDRRTTANLSSFLHWLGVARYQKMIGKRQHLLYCTWSSLTEPRPRPWPTLGTVSQDPSLCSRILLVDLPVKVRRTFSCERDE